jgi:hypothetical protein
MTTPILMIIFARHWAIAKAMLRVRVAE